MKLKSILLLVALTTLFFNSCKQDPCEAILCLNGGYCANGDCVCPEGYKGADCSQQITPTQIKISKIEVLRFPATDKGAAWDLTDGPDIYPALAKNSVLVVFFKTGNNYQNANPSNIYSFDLTSAYGLSNPADQYKIILFDYDESDTDDFMGAVDFTPYVNDNKFPSTITIDAGGSVAFRLHVTYEWL